MKKLLLSVVAVVAISSASFAQVSVGVRAGLNLSNQKFKFDGDSEAGDIKPGFQIGAYLTGNLSDKLAIQPELVYSLMGAQESESGIDVKYNLSYISIPVLIRYNFTDMINLHLGPQFGILAGAKAKVEDESIDIKDGYKGLDVGAAIGLGLDFGKFNAGLRYYQGLSNIAEETDGDEKLTNSNIQIVLGYRLFGGE